MTAKEYREALSFIKHNRRSTVQVLMLTRGYSKQKATDIVREVYKASRTSIAGIVSPKF